MEKIITYVKWKPIKGFEEYFVSNNGLVRKGKLLQTLKVEYVSGYLYIRVIKEEKGVRTRHHYFIHRLVWETFGDTEKKKGYQIHHKDFNFLNNHIDNLEYIKSSDHLILHGKKPNKTLL